MQVLQSILQVHFVENLAKDLKISAFMDLQEEIHMKDQILSYKIHIRYLSYGCVAAGNIQKLNHDYINEYV